LSLHSYCIELTTYVTYNQKLVINIAVIKQRTWVSKQYLPHTIYTTFFLNIKTLMSNNYFQRNGF